MITLREAAEQLGVSPSTLKNQIHNGKLIATKFGNTWVVTAAEVERYRREHLRGREK